MVMATIHSLSSLGSNAWHQLSSNNNNGSAAPPSAIPSSRVKKTKNNLNNLKFKVSAEYDYDEKKKKQTGKADRWKGLVTDTSDDQQDITRGKGMVDSLFQAPMGTGTHHAVMSSYDYVSHGHRQFDLDNSIDGLYIAPAFMDKLVVHIAKSFLSLPLEA